MDSPDPFSNPVDNLSTMVLRRPPLKVNKDSKNINKRPLNSIIHTNVSDFQNVVREFTGFKTTSTTATSDLTTTTPDDGISRILEEQNHFKGFWTKNSSRSILSPAPSSLPPAAPPGLFSSEVAVNNMIAAAADRYRDLSTLLTPRKRSFDDQWNSEAFKNGRSKREILNIGEKNKKTSFRIYGKEPKDDGYEWRNYGTTYRRSYYKCANQGCKVKKRVERDKDDPNYHIVIYRGVHKCSSNPPWVPSPEYLERCSSYCWLFPPGYEFERDSMVQLWIAEEVIDGDATERLEDKGYICLELLLSLGVIEPSGLHKRDHQSKFKVSEHFISEHYANRGNLEDDFLIIGKDGFSNISRMPLHLSLLVERFDCQIPELLQMRQRLRTLLLLGESKYLVKKVPRDLFLSLNLLRTLVLSGTQVSELPSSVGNLEDLRYFDLSGTLVKELPGVLCDLVTLQTLKLRDCSEFTALPKGMMKLINLRHLDLDIVHQLSYMPKSIGN